MSGNNNRMASNEFYKAKGLKRVSVTLTEGTINFLEDKRKEFSAVKVTKQGDIVDAMASLYMSNPEFAAALDAEVIRLLEEKVVQKAGRKDGWRKENTAVEPESE